MLGVLVVLMCGMVVVELLVGIGLLVVGVVVLVFVVNVWCGLGVGVSLVVC